MSEPIGGIYVLIDGDYAPLIKALQEAEKIGKDAADKFGQSWADIGGTFQKLGSDISSLGATLTAAITVPLVGVSTAALMVSGSLEQANVAFKTMLGSAIQAQNHLDELKKFALSTPFEFPDLVQASKRLQALGFTAQEIIPTLTAVGNAAAAMGTGALGIERITLALGQMQAKGKVSAQDMRQLAEAGIPAWQILADAISKAEGKVVSVAQVMKRAEDGFVDGNMAVTALIEGMQKKFGGLMEAQAKTLLGIWSNFKDQVTFVLGDIGDALAPLAKQMLAQFTEILKTIDMLVGELKKLPPGVQEAALAFAVLAAAAGPVLFIVGQLTTAVGSIISLAAELGVSMAAVATAVGPVAGVLAALGVAIAAVHFTGLGDEIANFASAVKNNFSGIVDLFSDVIAGIKSLVEAFGTLTGAGTVIEALGLSFKNIKLSWQTFFEAAFPQFVMLREAIKLIVPFIEKMGGSYQSMATAAQLQLANLNASQADANRKVAEGAGAYDDLAKTATKRLSDTSAAAEAYAKKVSEAFSTIGLKDTALEAKKLQDAFDLIAKSGKLSSDQLSSAYDQLQFKLRQLAQDVPDFMEANRKAGEEIAKILEKTAEDAHKTEQAFEKAWLAWQKGAEQASAKQTDIKFSPQQILDNSKNVQLPGQTGVLGGFRMPDNPGSSASAIAKAVADAERLRAAYRGLGVDLHDTTAQQVKWFEDIANGTANIQPSVKQFEEAWQHVRGALEHMATYDLPKALEGFDLAIKKSIQLGEAVGLTLEKEAARYQAIIAQRELSGKSAAAEIEGLENVRLKQEQLIIQADTIGNVYKGLMKSFTDVFDNLDKGLTSAIVNGGKLGDVFKGLLKSFETDVVGTFVHGFTEGLKNAFLQSQVGQVISDKLTLIFKKLFDGLFNFAIDASKNAPQVAAQTANTTALATNTTALGTLTAALEHNSVAASVPGGGSGGASGGAGGGTSLASGVTAISSAVTAIASVLSYLQGRRMEQDIGRIEVTTRGMLNQLISLQGTLNTYLPEIADRTLGAWEAVNNVVEILRLMGQIGGNSSETLAQDIADAINENPHQTETLDVAVQSFTDGLQTTTSQAYELDQAVSTATDSLYALNEATQKVNGALPGFVDGMDRALFNSMAGSPGQPGQNLSLGGPRMNATPIIMPVPTMDAMTGNGGGTGTEMLSAAQRAAMARSGQTFPQSQAPQASGGGSGSGVSFGGATVYVTAVDPTSRSVTKGIITGLEEVGIRTR